MARNQYYQGPKPRTDDRPRRSPCVNGPAECHLHGARLDPQVHLKRKTNYESGSQLVGKIVVTCELSIFGLGTHSGIGEEWADNENAGTAAEAQAFKRACACFGLGRYLCDLEGGWVDLDNRKQPKSTSHVVLSYEVEWRS